MTGLVCAIVNRAFPLLAYKGFHDSENLLGRQRVVRIITLLVVLWG